MKQQKNFKIKNIITATTALFLCLTSLLPVLADDTSVITATSANDQNTPSHPSLVFTSPTQGYQFYLSAVNAPVRYSRTTDGGATWSAGVNITNDAQSLGAPTIWYDGWTQGDNNQVIHLVYPGGVGGFNTDALYDRVTIQGNGTLLNANSFSSQTKHNIDSTARNTVAKANDGKVYMSYLKTPYYDADEFGESLIITSCASDCVTGTVRTDSFVQNSGYITGDDILLRPIAGSKMIAFIWDTIGNKIYYKLLSGGVWGPTTYLADAIDDPSYRSAWGAVNNKATGEVYLVFNNNVATGSGSLKTYIFNASGALSVTAKTNVITADMRQADIAIDENTGNVYVAFIRDGGGSSKFEVYRSNNAMTSWTNLATVADDPFSDLYIADRNYIGLSLNQSSANVIGASLRDQNDSGKIYYVEIENFGSAAATCSVPNIISVTKADIVIDNDVHAVDSVERSPAMVFVNQNVGYMFTSDTNRNPIYRKTTNGGATWGTKVTLAAATSSKGLTVWHDQWTIGKSGTKVHIIYGTSSGGNNLNYMAFDTSNDTVSTPVKINNTTTNSLTDSSRYSITKMKDGALYATTSGTNGPLLKCTANCTSGANWTEIANYPYKTASGTHHDLKLLPLNDKLLALQWDITAHQIYHSIYNPTAGTWTLKTALAGATESSTYLSAWGGTVDGKGSAYLCFNSNVNNAAGSIQTARFDDTGYISGSLRTAFTGQHGQCDLAYNEHTGSVILSRNQILTTNVSRIKVSQSTDQMVTWSNSKVLNLTNRNYKQTGLNLSSDRKIYAWYLDDTAHDLYGNTILNIDTSRDKIFPNQSVADFLHF